MNVRRTAVPDLLALPTFASLAVVLLGTKAELVKGLRGARHQQGAPGRVPPPFAIKESASLLHDKLDSDLRIMVVGK